MTEGRLAPEEVRTRTFPRVVRGYRRREVRRLLERAAADLARLRDGPLADGPHDQPPLTAEQVEEARFQPALGGYEMDEVDTFLDKVVAELERAAREPFSPSALPAPPPQPPFPAATAGPPLAAAGPLAAATAGPPPAPTPGPPPVEPALPPAARAAVDPPTTGSVGPRTGRVAEGDKRDSRLSTTPAETAATPVPPAPAARAPAPAPVAPDDEGFFPPPSVPPSAAPAVTPPPPLPPSAPRPPMATPARPLTASEVEIRSFERGAPGYLPSHVDLFLAKAARALVGRDGETLTRWDVLRQRFPLGPRGYATNEVDAFLVRLAAQFPDPDPAAQREILRKLEGG
jgi:DivIVA domain-containing protein